MSSNKKDVEGTEGARFPKGTCEMEEEILEQEIVEKEDKVKESKEVIESQIKEPQEVELEEKQVQEPKEVELEEKQVQEPEEVESKEEEQEEVELEEEQVEESEEVAPQEEQVEELKEDELEEDQLEEIVKQEQPQDHVDKLVYRETMKEYIEQLERDNKDYDDEYEKCQNWYKNIAMVIVKFPETSEEVNRIVNELNENINSAVDTLTEEQKSNIENRAKGINIINKMFNNTLEKHLDKLKIKTVEKERLNELCERDICSEETISEKLNENYNLISQMRSKKDSVIKDYFNFISLYILPINDGIISGIQYTNLIQDKKINELILPTYLKLKEEIQILLGLLDIKEMNIKPCDALDYNKIEVFDIEETDNKALDETIHEVIRTGYSYKEDLYNTGENYVVRTAQVTVYKYDETSEAVDEFEI